MPVAIPPGAPLRKLVDCVGRHLAGSEHNHRGQQARNDHQQQAETVKAASHRICFIHRLSPVFSFTVIGLLLVTHARVSHHRQPTRSAFDVLPITNLKVVIMCAGPNKYFPGWTA
jgi:hypothetical protein